MHAQWPRCSPSNWRCRWVGPSGDDV